VSALQTQLNRRAASLQVRSRTRRHDAEVLSVTTTRASVSIAGSTYVASLVTSPRTPSVGDTVTVEFGAALPLVVAVRTPV
jgi:hypothetical protein